MAALWADGPALGTGGECQPCTGFPTGFLFGCGFMWAQGLPPVTPSREGAPSTQHRRDCHLLLLHQPGSWPCSLPKAEDTDETSIPVTVILKNGNSERDREKNCSV